MAFKINISSKDGKTYKLEAEAPGLMQKSLGDIIQGQEISPDLAGYELEITGLSDKAGFTSLKEIEGFGLKKMLLKSGKAMHKKPKGDKKKIPATSKGLRLRKTVRGKVIGEAIVQINTKIIKQGGKKLSEIFPEQNKSPEPETKPQEKQEESKTPEAPQNSQPENEPKENIKTEEDKAHPDEEPKETPKSIQENSNPDEEPK